MPGLQTGMKSGGSHRSPQAQLFEGTQSARRTAAVQRDKIIMGEVDYDPGWPRENDGVRSRVNRPLDSLCQLSSLCSIEQLPGKFKKRGRRAELGTPPSVINPVARGIWLLGAITPNQSMCPEQRRCKAPKTGRDFCCNRSAVLETAAIGEINSSLHGAELPSVQNVLFWTNPPRAILTFCCRKKFHGCGLPRLFACTFPSCCKWNRSIERGP